MKNFINLLTAFGLIGLAIYGVFRFLLWIYNQVLSIDPRISAALITGLLAIVATSLTITIPKYLEKKMEIEEHLRDKKSDTYKELVEFLFTILMGTKMGKTLTDKDIVEIMSSFTENLILWGSEDVIKRYKDYRTHFATREIGVKTTMREIEIMEGLLLAIRKDMGHKNKKLVRGDILSLFINDLEKTMEDLKQNDLKTG
ncbi:hypothetical protein [Priestia endophytica]|uniref:hypothetical protein n=1 Tax=Priestia endophytica TaxID=135735 RepID=UPI0020424649|nr:hypothetical protein [Priestia endophytica]MCM3541329.1 hypothetical protein [Priestia endophytica]